MLSSFTVVLSLWACTLEKEEEVVKVKMSPCRQVGYLFVAMLLLSALAGCNRHGPFLWRIEGQEGASSYLFGTIHSGDPRILKLAPVVEIALSESDIIYTEILMEDVSTMREELDTESLLPESKTLEDVLPAKLYNNLEQYCKATAFPLDDIARHQVWYAALKIMYRHCNYETVLDKSIAVRAKKMGKVVRSLEDLGEQSEALVSMLTLEEQMVQLQQVLIAMVTLERAGLNSCPIDLLLADSYLSGDDEEILQNSFRMPGKANKVVFYDRNKNMAQRIHERLKSEPHRSHFFAVGVGHLLGERSVVTLLRNKGLRITRLRRFRR